ncbi:MAG TPA: hypothetical protein DCG47_12300 [Spirochaetaceae bacterium]|nr:hypothetical protein [Spirochaetaceae bacterium]
MWDIQDDARRGLKELASWLAAARAMPKPDPELAAFNAIAGRLYFDLNANITREECALFPVMARLMDEADSGALLAQGRDYGWAFMDAQGAARFCPAAVPGSDALGGAMLGAAETPPSIGGFIGRTGALPPEVLGALFAALPVDMTYVDAEDRVRWFSDSPHRIFPRSPAIIGRDVHNCHPGASVGRVLAILEAFKSGAKDKESFWINMGGRFISIEYFALRAPDGRYLGTLEASQDLSEKRALSGEKRLAT